MPVILLSPASCRGTSRYEYDAIFAHKPDECSFPSRSGPFIFINPRFVDMAFQAVGIAALLALAASAAPTNTASPTSTRCKEVSFAVSGSATNFNLTGVDITDLSALLLQLQGDFPPLPVSGSQTLAGTYCGPTCQNSNNDKLQVLIGTITDNRNPWSATGDIALGYAPFEPETYSYVDYMNAKGYPTLSLDRLGTGLSSHPDPFTVVQGPYE